MYRSYYPHPKFINNRPCENSDGYRQYFTINEAARQAFKERQENGLNLLQKVWKYSDQFKEELEMGLDVGIRNGESADEKYQMPQLNL